MSTNNEVSREIAEALFPEKGMAANDSEVVEHLEGISNFKRNTTAIREEISRNSLVLDRLKETYPEINFNEAATDLKQDQTALSILTDRKYFESLLLGKAIKYQRVSLNSVGKPKRNFGLGFLVLTRKINSLKPTISIGYSPLSGLNPKIPLDRVGVGLNLSNGLPNHFLDSISKKFMEGDSGKDPKKKLQGFELGQREIIKPVIANAVEQDKTETRRKPKHRL